MNPIRFAFVGCGSIARKHIAAINLVEDAKLVAVSDICKDTAASVGQNCSVPFYTDPRAMADDVDFDVFVVLTPSGDHATQILDLVDIGRHFVVEKPLALRLEDADSIIQACDERGTKVFVIQQNRFNKPIRKLRATLDSGRLGKIVLGSVRVRWRRDQAYYDSKNWRGTWRDDGGVVANQASHHIDMLAWIIGDIEEVTAMCATRLSNIEVEDTAIAMLRFRNGALGLIEATTATRPKDLEGSISILAEGGCVEIGGFAMDKLRTWQMSNPEPNDRTVFEDWGENPDVFAWNHAENIRNIISSVRSGKRGLIEGLEGRRSLELITAIYESSETGRAVPLRFNPKVSKLGHG